MVPVSSHRRREHDPPFLVEDPDLLDLVAVGERPHQAVGLVFPPGEHLVVGGRPDRVREERGAADRLVEHLRALVPDHDEGEYGERREGHGSHRRDDRDAQPAAARGS